MHERDDFNNGPHLEVDDLRYIALATLAVSAAGLLCYAIKTKNAIGTTKKYITRITNKSPEASVEPAIIAPDKVSPPERLSEPDVA